MAKGTYVWFVDADDQIIPDKVPELINESISNQLDVLIFDYCDTDDNGRNIQKSYNMKEWPVLNGTQIANLAFEGGLVNNMGYPVRFIISKEHLVKNNISFPEQMVYGEDTVWMAKIVLLASRIKSTSVCAYKYIHHSNSTCGKMNTSYPGRTIFERCILVPEQIISFAKELATKNDTSLRKYSDELSQYAINNFLNIIPIMFGRMNNHERHTFYRLLYSDNHEIINLANLLTKVMLLKNGGKIFSFFFSLIYKVSHSKKLYNV